MECWKTKRGWYLVVPSDRFIACGAGFFFTAYRRKVETVRTPWSNDPLLVVEFVVLLWGRRGSEGMEYFLPQEPFQCFPMWQAALPKSSGFTFGLEEGQDVAFSHRSLHVADDLTVLFADEFNFDLRTLSLGPGTSENLDHAGENDWFIHYSTVFFDKFLSTWLWCDSTTVLAGSERELGRWRAHLNHAVSGDASQIHSRARRAVAALADWPVTPLPEYELWAWGFGTSRFSNWRLVRIEKFRWAQLDKKAARLATRSTKDTKISSVIGQ